MADITLSELERRIQVCEDNISEIYSKINKTDNNLVATTTMLNSVLSTLGELKGSVDALKQRPATMWDKLLYALIGAVVSGVVAYLMG